METQAQPGDICSAGNATPQVKVSGSQAEIGSRILKKNEPTKQVHWFITRITRYEILYGMNFCIMKLLLLYLLLQVSMEVDVPPLPRLEVG